MARQPEAAMVGPSLIEAEVKGVCSVNRFAQRAAQRAGRLFSRWEKMPADPRIGPLLDRLEYHRGIEVKMRKIGFRSLAAPFDSHCIVLLMQQDPTISVRLAASEVLRKFSGYCSEAVSLQVGQSAGSVARYNAKLLLRMSDSQVPTYLGFRNAVRFNCGLSYFPAVISPGSEEIVAFRRLSVNDDVVPAESISADFFVENASGRIRDIVCAELVFNGSREGFSRQPISPPRSIAALNGMQVFFSVLLGRPQDDVLLY